MSIHGEERYIGSFVALKLCHLCRFSSVVWSEAKLHCRRCNSLELGKLSLLQYTSDILRYQDYKYISQLKAMDALLMVATLVLVWAPLHLHLTKTDVADLQGLICSVVERVRVDPLKAARVEEEMLKVRQKNYKLFSRCCSHLGLVTGSFSVNQACGRK